MSKKKEFIYQLPEGLGEYKLQDITPEDYKVDDGKEVAHSIDDVDDISHWYKEWHNVAKEQNKTIEELTHQEFKDYLDRLKSVLDEDSIKKIDQFKNKIDKDFEGEVTLSLGDFLHDIKFYVKK